MGRDQLAQLAEFVGLFEGWVLGTQFEPIDPRNMETAIRDMEGEIDAKAVDYAPNQAVQQVAAAMKAEYRQAIRRQTFDGAIEADGDAAAV